MSQVSDEQFVASSRLPPIVRVC